MAITQIKKNKSVIPVTILSAGISQRMKSYEPRCLLKYKNSTILESQIDTLKSAFNCVPSVVIGNNADKIIKKMAKNTWLRIIENKLHATTNTGESIRLAVNNNIDNHILLMHGDIVFNKEMFLNIPFNKSFIIIDNKQQILEREVGVTCIDNKATVLSYDLPTKWCQVAYFCRREYQVLESICKRDAKNITHKLFFEIINMIINRKGEFLCIEPPNMKIFEIDTMGDLNENINI